MTKKNSAFIVFSIELHAEKSKEKEVSESEEVEEDADEERKEGDERERGEETKTEQVKEVSLGSTVAGSAGSPRVVVRHQTRTMQLDLRPS